VRIVLNWGLVLAVAIALRTLLIHALGIYTTRIEYAVTVDRLVLVIPLAVLTLALVEQRRALGGTLRPVTGFR